MRRLSFKIPMGRSAAAAAARASAVAMGRDLGFLGGPVLAAAFGFGGAYSFVASGETCPRCGRLWIPSMGDSYTFPGSACDIGECSRPGEG